MLAKFERFSSSSKLATFALFWTGVDQFVPRDRRVPTRILGHIIVTRRLIVELHLFMIN